MSPISHWVVTTSLALSLLGSFCSGTRSSSGRSAITTPAACVPMFRSSPRAAGEIEQPRDFGVLLMSRRNCGSSSRASSSVMLSLLGISLLICSTRDRGMFITRPDVLDRRLGLERAERADLGDVGLAVLVPDVLDDLVAPLLAEVDVDIGRLGAIGVEEAFEEQVVLDRADAAELEQVADDGPAGRSPGQAGMPCSRAYRTKSQTIRK